MDLAEKNPRVTLLANAANMVVKAVARAGVSMVAKVVKAARTAPALRSGPSTTSSSFFVAK